MSSLAHGKSISAVEVANISVHGVWLLAHKKELFMSYDDFPWLKEQTIKSIINVEEQSPGHFYWPELDIDLTEEIIEHPERFPLKTQIT
ncbi:integron cassette protein [bacterium endosymbiont of Escarpia laminata]|nr:MAG: integron cassette protein [bacterium endosymbiont of Escarpia laminata]RLJ21925.1 MAG: integron cassette protein [bacterium endosymbiont of Escarpia laminata]